MTLTSWERPTGTRRISQAGRLGQLSWAPIIVALWLLIGGCGEQEHSASKDKEGSTATQSIAASKTSQRTSTSIVFESDRDGNSEIYVMDSDGTDQTRLTDNSSYDGQPVLSPEGQKVAFASDWDGSNDVYVMNLNAADQTRLTTAAVRGHELLEPSFSSDGAKVAFVSTREGKEGLYGDLDVHVVDSDGTNQKSLTNNLEANESGPVFSPDGEEIAFARDQDGKSEIYVINSDGTDQKSLTNSPEMNEYSPIFSPDGEKIAFTGITGSAQSPRADIYVMNADGTNQKRLTDDPAYDAQPAFSPDGDKIAFTSNRDGDYEVYVMDRDGTNLTQLTNNRTTDISPVFSSEPRTTTVAASRAAVLDSSNPIRLTDNLCYYPDSSGTVVISPDGSKAAFSGCGGNSGTGMFVANTDGTGVTDPGAVVGHASFAFSPNSSKIVFSGMASSQSDGTSGEDLYTLNADGTGVTRLTDDPATLAEQWLSFSPDGNKIAFVANTGPNKLLNYDVYVMDSDGTDRKNLTESPDTSESGPIFSPDGNRIAFVSTAGSKEDFDKDIYVMDDGGTGLTNLTDSPDTDELEPTFSPDGNRIAFERTTGPLEADIYIVNVDGTGLTRLIDPPTYDHQPYFIPGSEKVAFVSYRNGDEDIYVMDSDGTRLTNLTDTDWASENNPSFSSDGTKMAYASKRYDRSGYLVNEIYVKELHGAD